MLRNQRGMTLVEIMIVIAIIGGLMAVLGQTVFSSFSKGQAQTAKIQMREIIKGIEFYATDCGSFPKTLNALIEDDGSCNNWGPESYIKAKMLNDPWNNEFTYEKKGSDFVLISYGADGEPGGDGKDKDISSEDM